MKRYVKALLAAVVVPVVAASAIVLSQPAHAASLTQVTSFGTNPSNLNMYVYVPDKVAAKPAILVAVHYCTGTAPAFYSGNAREFVTAADQYGYIIVFPEATRSGHASTCTHRRRSPAAAAATRSASCRWSPTPSSKYNGDPSRVYVTGASSGAMMTNVLAADYPDVFKAGAAVHGRALRLFRHRQRHQPGTAHAPAARSTKTAQQWGDLVSVRGCTLPGYTGTYPRMQLWHGTDDTTLNYANFAEEIKQWTNLNGVSQTPVITDNPQSLDPHPLRRPRCRPRSRASASPASAHTSRSAAWPYAIDFFGLNSTATTQPADPAPRRRHPPPPPGTPPHPAGTPPVPHHPTHHPTNHSPGGGACRVAYTTSAWSTGLTANITITNTGHRGQRLDAGLHPAQRADHHLRLERHLRPTSGQVTATNASYNAAIAANASVGIGFQATTPERSSPTAFALNGIGLRHELTLGRTPITRPVDAPGSEDPGALPGSSTFSAGIRTASAPGRAATAATVRRGVRGRTRSPVPAGRSPEPRRRSDAARRRPRDHPVSRPGSG